MLVVLGELVGADHGFVEGDAEAGAEGDVEAAVAQGRGQVGGLRAGEQQVVQHQLGELDAVAQRAGGGRQLYPNSAPREAPAHAPVGLP